MSCANHRINASNTQSESKKRVLHTSGQPDSDIDLRLVCGNTMTFGTLYELSLELEKELGRKVDIVTNPPEHMRPAFHNNIEQDEVRLYEAK